MIKKNKYKKLKYKKKDIKKFKANARIKSN